jgi:hypothetical protein
MHIGLHVTALSWFGFGFCCPIFIFIFGWGVGGGVVEEALEFFISLVQNNGII